MAANEEQRKAELLTKLEQSEARLKMAMDSTHLGTWEYNRMTQELYCDPGCKKIFGYPESESLTFDALSDRLHPDDKARVQEKIRDFISTNIDGRFDITPKILCFDNNEARWIRVRGRSFSNPEGNIERFIGTALDITDIKLAEEKSAKLAAIIESTDDAIISKTVDGIVTSWNDSARRTFGYTADEMIGQPILRLIPADRQDEEPLILARLRRGERLEHFETKRLTKDGKLLDVSLTISPVRDTQGNIIGLSKIARDISEKKQEEQRKNDFVSMVSHELKTPLTSITAYVQLLKAKAMEEGDEFSTQALTRAEVQAKKMISLIQDFLGLARLQEGKVVMDRNVFDLYPLVKEIVADAQFLTSNHAIKIDCRENIMVHADREKIGLVLTNLLSNAVKYSPDGGSITIGCDRQDGKVRIYVSDDGVGIKEADQKRLFERFYRINNDKIKGVSGFGIGLYLVAEILRHHHSKMEVESKENVGSTFSFTLGIE